MDTGNLFADIPERNSEEIFHSLLEHPNFKLERIVSTGQTTPAGRWYDSETDEWVLLLSGGARLFYEGETETRDILPGDYFLIPAHKRHRVEWTDPDEKTVWLVLHYQGTKTSTGTT